jgi:hypothetical protein
LLRRVAKDAWSSARIRNTGDSYTAPFASSSDSIWALLELARFDGQVV